MKKKKKNLSSFGASCWRFHYKWGFSINFNFRIEILKAYNKPFTKCVEEGTLIANHQGELLNSKSEWHQAKVIRTTLTVVQGGAEVVTQQRPGRVQGGQDTAGQGHQSGQGEQGGQERRGGQQ